MKSKEEEKSIYQKYGINTASVPYKRSVKTGYLENIDEDFITEIQEYWEDHFGQRVDPVLNVLLKELTGKKDLRIIPDQVLRQKILPLLNDYDTSPSYLDKNLYDIFIDPPRSAETVVKNINDNYYDRYNNSINIEDVDKELLKANSDLIIKPSRSNNGKKIKKLYIKNGNLYDKRKKVNIQYLEQRYKKNFIVQKAVKQHRVLSEPHPSSVNTLRMYTMRWNNEIHYISSLARYGVDNSIKDNMGAGGLCLGIDSDGEFFDVAIDDDMQTYTHHPTSGIRFADLEPLPDFEKIKQFAKDCHRNILHLNYISWDIAVEEDGEPVFIEANFTGPLWIGQLITREPAFGKFTEEVLHYSKHELETREPKLMRKDRNKENKKRIKNLETTNKKLQDQLEKKEDEIKRIKQSKSWRYTSSLRSILGSLKKK